MKSSKASRGESVILTHRQSYESWAMSACMHTLN